MSEFRVSSGDLHLHLILEGGHDPSVERYMADAKRWEELAIDSRVQLMPNPYIYIYMVGMYIYISKQQLLVQSQEEIPELGHQPDIIGSSTTKWLTKKNIVLGPPYPN